MKAELYTLWGEEVRIYTNLPQVEIAHAHNEPPLEVAIGIDPSTTKTGFTIGRADSDCPFIGMEFVRDNTDTPFSFITEMIDYIIYNVIGANNLEVKYIFTEDKYEQTTKYSRHTNELLSTVKVGVNSLPARIKHLGKQRTTPKLVIMKPSEWRKAYLGPLNTNAKRDKIKQIVCEYTVNKYNFNYNNIFQVDMLESVGIYSAGFIKHIEPTLTNSTQAKVDLNNINWSHHIKIHKVITPITDNTLSDIVNGCHIMRGKKDKHGLKSFEYVRGTSLEKNIRGLTSKSNAIFVTLLDTWDLEAIPIYYELRRTPREGEKLMIVAYRENEK